MFTIGDYIVYGNDGICVVKDISQIDIPGAPSGRIYYLLSPVALKESKICSPVDNAKVIMRRIISRKEAAELLKNMDTIREIPVTEDKLMEVKYKEMIASCDLIQLISLVKTIRKKQNKRISEGKKITSTDDRYLKRAEDAICNELMIALDMEREEVQEIVGKL
ncbi:MAG: CarD family transcriptional regulator [Alistipes sp.]|nr:CarD family transcriptional regulator [Alistipes sp.]